MLSNGEHYGESELLGTTAALVALQGSCHRSARIPLSPPCFLRSLAGAYVPSLLSALTWVMRCPSAGDAGVGKSAMVQMFHSKGTHFPKQYQMTTGCDFVMKEIKLPDAGATVELHIYDCAGQAVFKELTCQYWKNANMVMLVYDVTNPESFQNLGHWLALVRQKCPEKVLPGVVVANKIDLEERQRVYIPEGQDFAKHNNLEFVQVSAHRNENIEKPFETISEMFHNAYEVCPCPLAGFTPLPCAAASIMPAPPAQLTPTNPAPRTVCLPAQPAGAYRQPQCHVRTSTKYAASSKSLSRTRDSCRGRERGGVKTRSPISSSPGACAPSSMLGWVLENLDDGRREGESQG